MTLKCTCGLPMRFVGSLASPMGGVVGIECPDDKCRKNKVVSTQEWIESLEWGPEEKLRGMK